MHETLPKNLPASLIPSGLDQVRFCWLRAFREAVAEMGQPHLRFYRQPPTLEQGSEHRTDRY